MSDFLLCVTYVICLCFAFYGYVSASGQYDQDAVCDAPPAGEEADACQQLVSMSMSAGW